MTTISVAGGSQSEILAVVKKAKAEFQDQIKFVVFDKSENIADTSVWEYVPCKDDDDAAYQAVAYVAQGKADILMKGIIQTHTLFKELFRHEHGLKDSPVISHVGQFEVPSRPQPFLLTDSGLNIAPDKDQLIAIVDNAVKLAHKLGITKPKVALLSAAENYNPKMPSSQMAKEITDYFQGAEDRIVFGPLSLDLSLSKAAVEHKRYQGPIMGDADVVVVPQIDTGNALYKSLTIFADATVGGSIVGTKVPVILTSRSDSTDTKYASLKFALKQL